MQRLEVSCAVRRLYRSLGVRGLNPLKSDARHDGKQTIFFFLNIRFMQKIPTTFLLAWAR